MDFIRSVIIFSFVIGVICSCKKKDKKEETPEPEPQTQTPFIPTNIDGRLQVSEEYYFRDDSLRLRVVSASGLFYKSPKNKDSVDLFNDLVDVGNVALNQTRLDTSTGHSYFYYSQDDTKPITKPCNWNITGNGNFAQFSYSDFTPYPIYDSIKNLPDSLFLRSGNGVKIAINNFQGADKIEVTIIATDRPGTSTTKTLYLPTKIAVFEPKDVQNIFTSGDYIVAIKIVFYKNTYAKLGNKVLNFSMIYTVIKENVVSGIY